MRSSTLVSLGLVVAAIGVTAVIATGRDADPAPAPAPLTAPAVQGLAAPAAPGVLPVITVYKSPSCGCCTLWVDHVKEAGFEVVVNDIHDLSEIKAGAGVPARLQSCHTAIVDGYALEGHVPADLIQRMLAERPAVAGLAVPGMPMGSPGMEGPRKDPYDVVTFDAKGETTVYAKR